MTVAVNDTASDRFDFRETVLENGLRVVTLEDFTCPIVAVQVWYHVGSKDEPADRNGFAHMFEHMMFRGTDRLGPTDHFDLVRKTGGSCNAYTSFDNTTYVNVAPANQLEALLWLEAERMAALKIDDEGFHTERKVVEEERRMGLDQPYGSVMERVLPRVFPGHPYRWTPIGNIPHLRAATAQELQEFWDRFYVPNNATLVIVGAVGHDEAERLARHHFGWIPRCPDVPRVPAPAFVADGPHELRLVEKKGPVPVVGIGYRVVPLGHPDSAALEILAYILGHGESSRVHRTLVKERKIAAGAVGGLLQLEHAGLFGVGAALMPFGRKRRALRALEAEIEKIRRHGVSEGELLKAKNLLYRAQVQSRLEVESKAEALGRAATLLGGTEEVNRSIERFRAVTAEEVQRVAREHLTAPSRTTLVVRPTLLGMLSSILGALRGKASGAEEGREEPFDARADGGRATPGGPKAAAVRPAELPEAAPLAPPLDTLPSIEREERTLANGLRVVVVPDDDVPFVTLRLGLRHGACHEDPAAPGSASIACAMLTKGTSKRSAAQLAEDLETYAVDVSGNAGHDTSVIAANALSEHFERALEALAEVVREPTFPEDEFRTLIRSATTGKLVEEKEPGFVAGLWLDRALFGAHPYARPADGLAADLRALGVGAARAWWERFARPGGSVLFIAGAVAPERAFDTAERLLGGWQPPQAAQEDPSLPELPARRPTEILLVDQPGATQSQIRIAQRVDLSHSSPDYSLASVLNQVFGGSFGSRLNQVVRVEKGLTYGIRGSLTTHARAAEFQVATFTQSAKTAEAIRVILGEVERLRTDPPTESELDFACSYLTGSAARRRETPQARVADLWAIESLGLPDDFFERHLEAIAHARPEAVVDVARRHIDPSELTIVVVGEADRIRKELEAIAPVRLVGGKRGSD